MTNDKHKRSNDRFEEYLRSEEGERYFRLGKSVIAGEISLEELEHLEPLLTPLHCRAVWAALGSANVPKDVSQNVLLGMHRILVRKILDQLQGEKEDEPVV